MELALQENFHSDGWLAEAFNQWAALLPQTWSEEIEGRSGYVQGMCSRTDYLTTLKNRLKATVPGDPKSEEYILDCLKSARAFSEHRQLRKALLLAQTCLEPAEGSVFLTLLAKLTL